MSAKTAGRPRQADLDRRIAEAMLRLVHDLGPTAVTVERVAQESGVAKTSIYRRHANRADLLGAVLAQAVGDPEVPASGSVRERVEAALRQLWRQMAEVLGPGGLAAVIRNDDPEVTALIRAALRPYDEQLVAQIREDRDAGLLRPDVDPEAVVSLMLGAYLGELVRNGTVADDWMERSLELVWRMLTDA